MQKPEVNLPYETYRNGEWSPTDRILLVTATDFWFVVDTGETRQRPDVQASIAAAEAGETLSGYDGHRFVKWRKREITQ
jgi:ABC-type transport system substrate-binding protein